MGEKIKADRARLRSLGPNAVAGGFLGVLRHQGLEFGPGPLMVEKGRAGGAEEAGELGPGIGLAHIDDANRFDPRPRRLDPIGARRVPGLNAAPEPALGGDQKVLVERVGGDGHLDPFAPAGDDREDRRPGVGHPHVVLQLGHVLFGRRFFGERPGQHELGLEHRVEVVDEPIEGRRQIAMHRVPNPALNVGDDASGVALVPGLVERLGGDAELDDEIAATNPPARPRRAFPSRAGSAPPRRGS